MEREYKLSIADPQTKERLLGDEELLGEKACRVVMKATYYDTAHLTLGKERIGLRLRQENGSNVATLKFGGGVDGGLHLREEVNCEKTTNELSLDDFPKQKPWLLDVLGEEILLPVVQTDIVRYRRILFYGDTRFELALDEGVVLSNGLQESICELEIELLTGSLADLDEFVAIRLQGYALEPEAKSKLQRGLALWQKAKQQ